MSLNQQLKSACEYLSLHDYTKAEQIMLSLLETHDNNPDVNHLLGIINYSKRELKSAIAYLEKAITKNAKAPDYWSNLGLCYEKEDKFNLATGCYQKALALFPSHVNASYNLANCYLHQNLYDIAVKQYQHVLELSPHHHKAKVNLGSVYKAMGDYESARVCYQHVLDKLPASPDANWNMSVLDWLQGDVTSALKRFSWRWSQPGYIKPKFQSLPLWEPNQAEDACLLVWGEQGVGDEVMFARALLDMDTSRVKHLTMACTDRLVPVFTQSSFKDVNFISFEEAAKKIDTFTHQIAIGDLFADDCIRQGNVSHKEAYIKSSELHTKSIYTQMQAFCQHNDTCDHSKPTVVGLSWRTNNKANGIERSLPLESLQSLLSCKDLYFIPLQYGLTEADWSLLSSLTDDRCLMHDIEALSSIEHFVDLVDVCDVVVTIDNSTVHFAGALGKETLLLLPYTPDWRWQLAREDTLWYESVTCLRQTHLGDWSTVISSVVTKLTAREPKMPPR